MTNGDTATSNGPVAENLTPVSPVAKLPPSPTSPSSPPLTPDGLGPAQMGDNIDREEVEQVVNRYKQQPVIEYIFSVVPKLALQVIPGHIKGIQIISNNLTLWSSSFIQGFNCTLHWNVLFSDLLVIW